ncbi:unnamed protein product [Dicrocoelium dendriticum]|nr:unnamed protein product [Dicrocoelium dendriticum]
MPQDIAGSEYVNHGTGREGLPKKKKKRKTLKAKSTTSKSRSKLKKKPKSKKLVKHRKNLTATQRRLRMRAAENTSLTSSASRSSDFHSSPHKRPSIRAVPRLSLFGAEPISGVFDESPPIPATERTRSQPSSSATFPSVNRNLLSEIEAKQASTFRFTTRHMHVNPDHSICPIPVSQSSTSASSSSVGPRNNLTHAKCYSPDVKTSLPNRTGQPTTTTQPQSQRDVQPSSSDQSRTGHSIGTVSKKPAAQTAATSTGAPGSSASSQNGWNSERLNHIRTLVKANLRPHFASGLIDKATYKRIRERILFKVQQKQATKVTDNRVVKLVNEYVDYCLRHTPTDSSNRSEQSS